VKNKNKMFQKWKDRLSSTISGGNSNSGKVDTLVSMGFGREQANEALRVTDGNVERAAEYLLTSSSSSNYNNPSNSSIPARASSGTMSPNYGAEEEQLRRAMEASLQTEESRHINEAISNSTAQNSKNNRKKDPRSMSRAGQAAAERAAQSNNRFGANGVSRKSNNISNKKANLPKKKQPVSSTSATENYNSTYKSSTNSKNGVLSHSHPNVSIPVAMKDKSKEEQILRCTKRLAPHATAIDTLLVALTAIRTNPTDDKYRKVDKTTLGYQNALHNKPGAEDLLLAVNFQQRSNNNELVLLPSRVDMALLYLGISALEQARQTLDYRTSKQNLVFQRQMRAIHKCQNDPQEIQKRSQFLSLCPNETGTGGALVQCKLGEDLMIKRKFDSDDLLKDVINWIGAHGSEIPQNIENGEWCLTDINIYPITPIDTKNNMGKTLQFIGCWPSGRLEIRPTPIKNSLTIDHHTDNTHALGTNNTQ
jgi:hypothetical protein